MNRDPVHYTVVESPIGELLVTSEGKELTGLYMEWHKGGPEREAHWQRDDAGLKPAGEQLSAYFSGKLQQFDLTLDLRGTEFQRRVWDAVLAIPYGETISYAEVARRIGSPKAVRAVGTAIGRNPVSIVVPCHRVIGSGGGLGGYGGGLDRKTWLLEHERIASSDLFATSGSSRRSAR